MIIRLIARLHQLGYKMSGADIKRGYIQWCKVNKMINIIQEGDFIYCEYWYGEKCYPCNHVFTINEVK